MRADSRRVSNGLRHHIGETVGVKIIAPMLSLNAFISRVMRPLFRSQFQEHRKMRSRVTMASAARRMDNCREVVIVSR